MGAKTGIEWTGATWNPILGCSRVSEGCRNCYAEGIAGRFGAGKETVYSGLTQIVNGRAVWTGQIKETRQLLQPLSWRKPKHIFVNSMSDLFHENVTDEQRDRIFAVMALCPQHTFQVLTKRPERMLKYFNLQRERCMSKVACDSTAWHVWAQVGDIQAAAKRPIPSAAFYWTGESHEEIAGWPLKNVWLGVSVENQAAADERLPLLLQTPAAVRFISAEPLLGPVDLQHIRYTDDDVECEWNALTAYHEVLNSNSMDIVATAEDGVTKLDWVICGGESGPNARPMHPDWARSLRDQCAAAGVPFFFKQWGQWAPTGSVDTYGRVIDGKEIKGRKYPRSEGVSMLRDGRICLKDFTVAEHRRRMKSGDSIRALLSPSMPRRSRNSMLLSIARLKTNSVTNGCIPSAKTRPVRC